MIDRLRGEKARVSEENARLELELDAMRARRGRGRRGRAGAGGAARRARFDSPRVGEMLQTIESLKLRGTVLDSTVLGFYGSTARVLRFWGSPVLRFRVPRRHGAVSRGDRGIHGQRYPIRSALDPAYVAELAAYVDEKIRPRRANHPPATRSGWRCWRRSISPTSSSATGTRSAGDQHDRLPSRRARAHARSALAYDEGERGGVQAAAGIATIALAR